MKKFECTVEFEDNNRAIVSLHTTAPDLPVLGITVPMSTAKAESIIRMLLNNVINNIIMEEK